MHQSLAKLNIASTICQSRPLWGLMELHFDALVPGGILLYVHTYICSGHFLGFKNLNCNIFLFIRKMNSFWGKKILCIFIWGHLKIGLYIGVISMHFRVQNAGYFLGVSKISNIFLECMKFLIFFWVNGR